MSHRNSEEIERGLVEVAAANGNVRAASKALAEQGVKVPKTTLHRWATDTHADRYLQIQAELMPRIRARAAEQHMELADRGMQLEHKVLEKLDSEVDEIPARDLPGAARNIATGAAIHTDKASVLRGEPTQILARHDIAEVTRSLRAKGIELEVVDAGAVEVEDQPALGSA